MERLTKRDKLGHWYTNAVVNDRGLSSKDGVIFCKASDVSAYDGEPIDRLAAYEDTGLEPEEIIVLCDMDRRGKMAEMLRMEEYGVPITRLRELAQADKEGRCVVLPCKVENTTVDDA